MRLSITEITCKSALTGSGGHYRLNPYVGCRHNCVYCYATYIARWREPTGPWGTWVQVKTNIPEVLERELRRRKGIEVFLSTVCDVYQPVEEQYRLTRRCLEALARAAETDADLSVSVLTKSELVCRDLDLLAAFPGRRLRVCFSMTTSRDDEGAVLEPGAARPSRRLAAARKLSSAGIPVSVLVNPILPYVTERDLPTLVGEAQAAGAQVGGFDMLHYLRGHVWGKTRWAYEKLGAEAVARLEEARNDPRYEEEVRRAVRRTMAAQGLEARRDQ
jgi:DNA repair photolyase